MRKPTIFSLLNQPTALRVDRIVSDADDIRAIEEKVKPVILNTEYSKATPETCLSLILRLSSVIVSTDWGSKKDTRVNLLIRTLVDGIAAKYKWSGYGTGRSVLAQQPYSYFINNGLKIYEEAVKTLRHSLPSIGKQRATTSGEETLSSFSIHDTSPITNVQTTFIPPTNYSGKNKKGSKKK